MRLMKIRIYSYQEIRSRMKKFGGILLVVLLILCVLCVNALPYRIYPADIKEVHFDIPVGESLPTQCYLRIVAGGSNTCMRPWRYCWARFGNIIFVRVLTLHHRHELCGAAFTWEEKVIPIGSCFFPGRSYIVVVNDVVATFVDGRRIG
jgi:hypothetical protein